MKAATSITLHIPFVIYFSYDGPSCPLFICRRGDDGTSSFSNDGGILVLPPLRCRNVTGCNLWIQLDQHSTSGSAVCTRISGNADLCAQHQLETGNHTAA